VSPFVSVPEEGYIHLARAKVPASLLAGDFLPTPVDREGLALVDLHIDAGRISHIATASVEVPAHAINLDEGQVWPAFVDVHTHLDKGHIASRAFNVDGTVDGAVRATLIDRKKNWNEADVRRRFEFALRCAWAHGTAAIRTHLDCDPPQDRISWPLFAKLREEWAGRIELQAVGKVPVEYYLTPQGEFFAEEVARHGGLLGGITRVFNAPPEKAPAILDQAIEALFTLAERHHLEIDLHVDETGDPASTTLGQVARSAIRHGFQNRVVCGHCCSLATQSAEVVEQTLDLCAEAGLAVVTLPMINLHLQDRAAGTTPRWRGVTLVHELAARGVPVAIASDNCRDPFFAFGDHDMLEVFSQAVRIAHLDYPYGDWPRAVTTTPADMMGLKSKGRISTGAPADLVLFRARSMSELLSRPQADRIVLRAGRPIDTTSPDYRELDDLLQPTTP
jgi:cytosine deaminase